jgi:thiamine biosynthesis lipoprotein ApbE
MREDEQRMILSDMGRRCDELDDLLSVFKPESDISRINENAGIGPVKISSMTYKILERALYFAEQTDGAFDPTIRPAVELWKIGKAGEHVPSAAECADVSRTCELQRPAPGCARADGFSGNERSEAGPRRHSQRGGRR